MALTRKFRDLLDELLDRRTAVVRGIVVGREQGKPKQFTKRIRDRLRRELLETASQLLVRQRAKREFRELFTRRRLRQLKGFGYDDRFDHMFDWAERELRGPIVYSFWRGRKCLYVGKGKTYRRLGSYKKSIYLRPGSSLEVWQVRTKRALPSAECLAVHLFAPRDNEKKAARVKWGSKCPICRMHDLIRAEISSLLRLRG
jgi:hypothetical protein